MAASILMESYLMATGYAVLMGADNDRAHLFARNYDFPVTADKLKADWEEFNGMPGRPIRRNPDGSIAMCPCGSGKPIGHE